MTSSNTGSLFASMYAQSIH
uniref:Uncharacterized protein n=1 Tax=Arundo donax TaxID=35708 RepID=A0A0A9AJX3_ARUDO